MSTVFEIVSEVVGLDKSIELMNKCGGMVFYIPTKPLHYHKIKKRVEHLREIGFNEKDIILELSKEYNRTTKATQNTIKKAQTRSLFD